MQGEDLTLSAVAEVERVVREMFRQQPDWVTFFREVLGVDGVAKRVFTTPEEMAAFEQSPQYAEIQQMIAELRGRQRPVGDDQSEPTRIITVRMPQSLHEALRVEAHQRRTSINKLCITKLLQTTDDSLVPEC